MANQQAPADIPSDFSVPPPPFFQNLSGPPTSFVEMHFPAEQGIVPGLCRAFHPNNGDDFNPVFPGPNNFNPKTLYPMQHGNGRGRGGRFTMNHNQHRFTTNGLFGFGNNGSNIHHSFPACPSVPQTQIHTFQWQGGRNRGKTSRGRGGRPLGRGANAQNGCNNYSNGGGKWSQQNGKKKKKGINKQDLAENNIFFCDICDRGFKTEEKYKEHIDGHQKCSFKDCPFVAAPKLVQLHITMQHRGGLAKRVWNIESNEDIEKWKEERRRNFPTASNVERKKQSEAERKATGAVIETKDFSKMRGRQRERGRGRRGGTGGGNSRQKHRTPVSLHSILHCSPENRNENTDDGAEGPPVEVKIVRPSSEPAASSSLQAAHSNPCMNSYGQSAVMNNSGLSLLTCYGDSSSDEGEEELDLVKTDSVIPSRKDGSHSSCPPSNLLDDEESMDMKNSSDFSGDAISEDPLSQILSAVEDKNSKDSDFAAYDCPEKEREVSDCDRTSDTARVANSHSIKLSQESCVLSQTIVRNSQIFHEQEMGKCKKRKSQNQNDDSDASGSKHQRRKKSQSLPRQYTLLERLLAPDIRRERNKILQCVHYIVKNKFFGVGSPSSSIAF